MFINLRVFFLYFSLLNAFLLAFGKLLRYYDFKVVVVPTPFRDLALRRGTSRRRRYSRRSPHRTGVVVSSPFFFFSVF